MTGRPSLRAELEQAIAELGPDASRSELARRVRRRKADVLAELRTIEREAHARRDGNRFPDAPGSRSDSWLPLNPAGVLGHLGVVALDAGVPVLEQSERAGP